MWLQHLRPVPSQQGDNTGISDLLPDSFLPETSQVRVFAIPFREFKSRIGCVLGHAGIPMVHSSSGKRPHHHPVLQRERTKARRNQAGTLEGPIPTCLGACLYRDGNLEGKPGAQADRCLPRGHPTGSERLSMCFPPYTPFLSLLDENLLCW